MGDWDFLHGLSGQELDDAMSSGATAEEWSWVEAHDAQEAAKTKEAEARDK